MEARVAHLEEEVRQANGGLEKALVDHANRIESLKVREPGEERASVHRKRRNSNLFLTCVHSRLMSVRGRT